MAAGKHTHLILAGDPHLTREIRRNLPKAVAAKLIDTIPAASRDAQSDVVTATLSAFVEWEEQESQAVAARFVKGIRTQARAVAGAAACLEALRQRRADILLLARDIAPKPGWLCSSCGTLRIDHDAPDTCSECGKSEVCAIDGTETLVRLAGQQDCPIEVVDHCDPLMALGGVGCLTRY
jgi:peptide subunit release factor 1 (eRF1)